MTLFIHVCRKLTIGPVSKKESCSTYEWHMWHEQQGIASTNSQDTCGFRKGRSHFWTGRPSYPCARLWEGVYLSHDWFRYVTWLVPMCVTWLVHMCVAWLVPMCVTWLVHMCVTGLVPKCVTWLVHMRVIQLAPKCVTWLVHMCVTWCLHMWELWIDVFTCGTLELKSRNVPVPSSAKVCWSGFCATVRLWLCLCVCLRVCVCDRARTLWMMFANESVCRVSVAFSRHCRVVSTIYAHTYIIHKYTYAHTYIYIHTHMHASNSCISSFHDNTLFALHFSVWAWIGKMP